MSHQNVLLFQKKRSLYSGTAKQEKQLLRTYLWDTETFDGTPDIYIAYLKECFELETVLEHGVSSLNTVPSKQCEYNSGREDIFQKYACKEVNGRLR